MIDVHVLCSMIDGHGAVEFDCSHGAVQYDFLPWCCANDWSES